MEFTQLFDGPGVTECYRRSESIVPQQALALANSRLTKDQARRLARTLVSELGRYADVTRFIDEAFLRVLSRAASAEESQVCREFLDQQSVLLADPARLSPATVGQVASLPPAADPKLRAKENLVLVLMNHNDFVTIR